MKSLKKLFISSVISLCLLGVSQTSFAAVHLIGLDVVRLADKAQFEGMFNFFYQMSLGKTGGVNLGYASGEGGSVAEGSYKGYFDSYVSGMYWQAGGAYFDYDQGGDDEFGILGGLGYESSPRKHLVIGIAAKVISGPDHPVTGESDPIFYPSINVMYVF